MRAQRRKLYHLGIRNTVSRNTLANANKQRDWRIYADVAQELIRIARPMYADEDLGLDLDNTVFALDASTIDLCLSVFPWVGIPVKWNSVSGDLEHGFRRSGTLVCGRLRSAVAERGTGSRGAGRDYARGCETAGNGWMDRRRRSCLMASRFRLSVVLKPVTTRVGAGDPGSTTSLSVGIRPQPVTTRVGAGDPGSPAPARVGTSGVRASSRLLVNNTTTDRRR